MMTDVPMAQPPPTTQLPRALQWRGDPQTIPIKIQAVVEILWGLRLSPVEFLITLLGRQAEYKDNSDGFYCTQGLECLLNICSADKRGTKKLNVWIGARATNMIVWETHREMDALGTIFKQSTKDLTPEALTDFDFQRDVTAVCKEHAPNLHQALMAAAQTV
ncbi:hypothetical protein FB451DRAFT_1195523 [Mycena latifolia]|nr:hypothetical protein FB451DRAFT_1195523 [Mycena latifolia]